MVFLFYTMIHLYSTQKSSLTAFLLLTMVLLYQQKSSVKAFLFFTKVPHNLQKLSVMAFLFVPVHLLTHLSLLLLIN
jgi:hypothetical protein